MHPYVAALGLSGLLVLAGTAFSFAGNDAFTASAHEGHAPEASGGHGGHGGGAYPWEGGTGEIPKGGLLDAKLERRSRIVITDDTMWNPANGIRSGTGSFEDPFVISGWHVDQVLIANTYKAFEFKENYVADILVLDWTGQGGYVHHNHLNDMRTNQNVARTGDPSATVIEHNLIGKVTELRHFDGIVRNNTIGRPPLLDLVDLDNGVTFNIAGLNGAGIHDNVIHGGVDMKIHGHHHSDAWGLHSHNHGAARSASEGADASRDASSADEAQKEDHVEDHQVRYVDFLFYNNTIKDTGFGLRYNDEDHAGDDRTATSEQEPDLELPHIHHTRVAIVDNVVEGATLNVDILNSADERHLPGETGELILKGNRVLESKAGDGIVVQAVQNAHVLVEGNRIERASGILASKGSGILLHGFANSTITVVDNVLGDYTYGIRASHFDANTTWVVGPNTAPKASYPVYWDDSVPNAPEGAEGEHAHGAHEREHGASAVDAPAALLGRKLRVG